MTELQNTAPGTPAPNGGKYHLVYHFDTRTAWECYTKGVDLEMIFPYFPDESEIQDKIYEYILDNNMWQLIPGSISFKSVWVQLNHIQKGGVYMWKWEGDIYYEWDEEGWFNVHHCSATVRYDCEMTNEEVDQMGIETAILSYFKDYHDYETAKIVSTSSLAMIKDHEQRAD